MANINFNTNENVAVKIGENKRLDYINWGVVAKLLWGTNIQFRRMGFLLCMFSHKYLHYLFPIKTYILARIV